MEIVKRKCEMNMPNHHPGNSNPSIYVNGVKWRQEWIYPNTTLIQIIEQ